MDREKESERGGKEGEGEKEGEVENEGKGEGGKDGGWGGGVLFTAVNKILSLTFAVTNMLPLVGSNTVVKCVKVATSAIF